MCENVTLSVTSMTTVNFIEHVDKLFDIFNSRTQTAIKNFKQPFKNNSKRKNHLLKC